MRMWHLQVIRGDELTQRSENNSVRLRKIKPLRGVILDTNGQVLVDNQPSFDIIFVPNRNRNIDEAAYRLRQLFAAKIPHAFGRPACLGEERLVSACQT